MSKQSLPRLVGGLLLAGLALTGCTSAPVTMKAPTAVPVAVKTPAKATNQGPFVERAEVGGGACTLTATPLKLGPAQFTVEAEGGLVPIEVQGIMTTMGHGFDYQLTAADGHWTAKGAWPMDGRWLVRVKAQDKTGEIQTALFYVDVTAQ
jgi:hypothetical protein